MSLFEDVMSLAVQMPMTERERLGRALGLNVHTKGPGKTLPMNQFVNRPDLSDPQAWRRAETGHAVLDTERAASAPAAPVNPGPDAIRGLWDGRAEVVDLQGTGTPASNLRNGAPCVVATDVCLALALGDAQTAQFFAQPPIEIRLATATYLALLGACEDDNEVTRVRAFVSPYAVLSLGPMASSRAAELMTLFGPRNGLTPLDALAAATALAHEIPLVARDAHPFDGVPELQVLSPQ